MSGLTRWAEASALARLLTGLLVVAAADFVGTVAGARIHVLFAAIGAAIR